MIGNGHPELRKNWEGYEGCRAAAPTVKLAATLQVGYKQPRYTVA